MAKKSESAKTRKHKCPICDTPITEDVDTFPFCSQRCKSIDLGQWLGERYRISRPIERSDLEEGE